MKSEWNFKHTYEEWDGDRILREAEQEGAQLVEIKGTREPILFCTQKYYDRLKRSGFDVHRFAQGPSYVKAFGGEYRRQLFPPPSYFCYKLNTLGMSAEDLHKRLRTFEKGLLNTKVKCYG